MEQDAVTTETQEPVVPVAPVSPVDDKPIDEPTKTKKVEKDSIWAIGRRKSSIARAKVTKGTGQLKINNLTMDKYFGGHMKQKDDIQKPMRTLKENIKNYDILILVSGGGPTGQAGAIQLAIARALNKLNPELRPKLKELGLLRRDPREVERKKSGQPKARKKFQWTKR